MRKHMLYISSVVLFTSLLLGGCSNPNPDAYSYSYEQRLITVTTEPSDAKVTLVSHSASLPPFWEERHWTRLQCLL